MAKREQGTTGLIEFNGIIQEDFLREMRGKEAYKRFREMTLNSPIVGAMLYYHEMAVRRVSWNFANRADKETQDERVDFLNYARENMSQSWTDAVSEWLSFLWAGFSLSYPLYKRDERNQVIWDCFSPRKQNTVYQWLINTPGRNDYDPKKHNGAILGFTQQAPPTYELVSIPTADILHFRARPEINNPEGISLLRNAWIPYYYCKNLQSVEAIGYERDLTGLPVVTMPQGATLDEDNINSDANKAAEMVRNVRNDEQGGIVKPFGWEFELLSGAGKGFADIGRTIERYESRIFMAMLSQFIMLGQGDTGSYSLSQDQTDIAEMIVNTTADIIAETFTKQEIPRLLRLNGYDPTDIVLEHSPAGDTDTTQFADFLQKVGDKLTWTPRDEMMLRQIAGLPEMGEDEIATLQEEQKAEQEEQRQAFMERAGGGFGNKKEEKPGQEPDENSVTLFASDKPLDEYKRRRAEREWNQAMTKIFAKQKRRLMQYAKDVKSNTNV
jgi:hypothetical protein